MATKHPSKASVKASAKSPPQAESKARRNTTGDSFFGWDGEVLVLNVLGKPSASKDAIGKPKGTQLKISVTAAPKDGKATDYMVRFLAPLFGVAVADIEVVFGQENVNKQLRIRAPKKLPAVFTDIAASAD
jgi:uncharacterized protein (TIGR00251 family)